MPWWLDGRQLLPVVGSLRFGFALDLPSQCLGMNSHNTLRTLSELFDEDMCAVSSLSDVLGRAMLQAPLAAHAHKQCAEKNKFVK